MASKRAKKHDTQRRSLPALEKMLADEERRFWARVRECRRARKAGFRV